MKPTVSTTLFLLALTTAGCASQRAAAGTVDAPRSVTDAPSTTAPAASVPGGATGGEDADHAMADHAGHEMMSADGHEAMSAGDHADHMGDVPATAGPGYTVADVRFMQMMIAHHEQALRMVALAPDRDVSRDLRSIATRINISQRDEITMMEDWLRRRDQVVPDEEQKAAMKMAGLLTPEEFALLEAARGEEFDRLFLTGMIQHHQGALQMVDVLLNSYGGGLDDLVYKFASDTYADQGIEIDRMQQMLAAVPGNEAR